MVTINPAIVADAREAMAATRLPASVSIATATASTSTRSPDGGHRCRADRIGGGPDIDGQPVIAAAQAADVVGPRAIDVFLLG